MWRREMNVCSGRRAFPENKGTVSGGGGAVNNQPNPVWIWRGEARRGRNKCLSERARGWRNGGRRTEMKPHRSWACSLTEGTVGISAMVELETNREDHIEPTMVEDRKIRMNIDSGTINIPFSPEFRARSVSTPKERKKERSDSDDNQTSLKQFKFNLISGDSDEYPPQIQGSETKFVRENRGPELSETICAHGSSRGNQESHARRQDRCMSRELEDIAQKSDVHKTQNGGPHTVLREISAGTEYTDRWLPVDPSPQIDTTRKSELIRKKYTGTSVEVSGMDSGTQFNGTEEMDNTLPTIARDIEVFIRNDSAPLEVNGRTSTYRDYRTQL
ncbi:hypothetical protein C8J57DRAFT_1213026 [Mycena rebaudengoi]|nr:hypothetical protein C8J57DRAFT_1213026 [Mycena rebaudengoi]